MKIIDKILPDYCHAKRNISPAGLVIHYFSCINVDPAAPFDVDNCIDLFKDLNRPKSDREHYINIGTEGRMYASAHLLIPREPAHCIRLIPEEKKAYHAGRSSYNGLTDWNRFSIGVELIGTKNSGFTDFQYDALAWYISYCMARYQFGPEMVVGHETIAPSRKTDPGIKTGNFDWDRLQSMIQLDF
jgi:AmpD protein